MALVPACKHRTLAAAPAQPYVLAAVFVLRSLVVMTAPLPSRGMSGLLQRAFAPMTALAASVAAAAAAGTSAAALSLALVRWLLG